MLITNNGYDPIGYDPITNSAQQLSNNISNNIQDFFGFGTQERQQNYNSAEALDAYNRQRELIKDQYKLHVEGMKEAGLNPALMFHNGALNSSVAVTQASQNGNANNQSFTNTLMGGILGGIFKLISKNGTSAKTIINNKYY